MDLFARSYRVTETRSNKISRFLSKSDHASRYHPRHRGLCNSCCTYYTLHQIWSRLENKNTDGSGERSNGRVSTRARIPVSFRETRRSDRLTREMESAPTRDARRTYSTCRRCQMVKRLGTRLGREGTRLVREATVVDRPILPTDTFDFRRPIKLLSWKIEIGKKEREKNAFSEGGDTTTLERNVLTQASRLYLLVPSDRWISLSLEREKERKKERYCAPYTGILYTRQRSNKSRHWRVTGRCHLSPPSLHSFLHFVTF